MKHIAIIGAGGHGREVLGILGERCQSGASLDIVGFIDENPDKHGEILDGIPVLGDFNWFQEKKERSEIEVICAVGSPVVTRKLADTIRNLDLRLTNAISLHSDISPRANLGEGVVIFPNVVINTGASIGHFVTLNVAASVSHDSFVGDYSNVNPGVRIAGNVRIGEGCYLGMGANIIQNVSIGQGSTIGAGATVLSDIPERVTAVGVPARTVRTQEQG
jgi:sugar O-acyltransferase (sialic acid O-acetyltransferase NeuD family)